MSQDPDQELSNRRVLVVDDNQAIHGDFQKVLGAAAEDESAFTDAESALFGDEPSPGAAPNPSSPAFEIDSALQGQEAHERVRAAVQAGRPYAMAFVDMRMPPGWDGVETIRHLWEADPDLQVVVCTAYADYSWSEMIAALGKSDRLLILKKPFDAIEVLQLASALTEKWNVALRERVRLQEVKRAEQEARAYAASLETVNRALEAAKATAEAMAQTRSDFLARMAHEVLSPLASLVAGSAEALAARPDVAPGLDRDAGTDAVIKEGRRRESWSERLELLCREGAELCGKLEDVIELSEIDAGRFELASARCAPAEVVSSVLEAARPAASAKGVVLELERGSGVPDALVTDPARLRHVLARLVENAVRSTGTTGSVRVSLAAAPADWQGPMLEIAIADQGPGLTREQQTRLFEPFAPLAQDAHAPRSGLGLSLAKRVARLLGGDLRVESTPGKGSRLVLALRARAAIDAPV